MLLDLKRTHQVYKLASGEVVPGVTSILGVLAKPALIQWAASMERDGILAHLEDIRETYGDLGHFDASKLPAAYYHATKRDKAADLGTVIHARIEAWHRGEELEPDGIPPEMFVQSAFGFSRYLEWWNAGGFKLVASEHQMVSEDLRAGGTMDVLARDAEGRLVLVDIKSTKPSKWWPYPEAKSQTSVYSYMAQALWDEKVSRVIVVRVGSSEGDELQTYELDMAERAAGMKLFTAARAAYDALKELK